MTITRLLSLLALTLLATSALAEERFPPPEFESGYTLPGTETPGARSQALEYFDVAVLAASLGLVSYLVFVKRSRRAVAWMTVFALLYFGFYREGCVCPIGATQNVALGLFDSTYAIPATVVAFFFLPLIFAFFWGRSFCAAVCPLGAIQDLVLVRPVRVPSWLDHALDVLAHVYLGLAVLLAALGAAFIICEYDPFVGFFRMSGGTNMLLIGGLLLLVGLFIGRPYCRYLCPYGVLLGLASRLSRGRIRITPDRCVRCRLCEDSCPFEAIRPPTAPRSPVQRARAKRTLVSSLLIAPLLIAGGAWLGSELGAPLARMHPAVQLADKLYAGEPAGEEPVLEPSDEAKGIAKAGKTPEETAAEAAVIERRFVRGGWWFGVWVGLVLGLKLIHLSRLHSREDYEADRATCVACARCFDFCPEEHERRKQLERA